MRAENGAHEVPIARFMPAHTPAETFVCRITGGIDLFDGQAAGITPNDIWNEPTIDQLYPSHAAYVTTFIRAVNNLVKAGFMLEPDAEIAKTKAADSDIGR